MALPRRANIGIIGGGQLAKMLAQAASKLGFIPKTYDPNVDAPAFAVSGHVCADFNDEDALERFACLADVVTYEFENIPTKALEIIGEYCSILPGIGALAISQDRLAEKRFLEQNAIKVAPYRAVNNHQQLKQALADFNYHCIIKSRRFGYDGKGQVVVRGQYEFDLDHSLPSQNVIVEGIIPFSKEGSVIIARGADGAEEIYDLVENHHQDNILRRSLIPAKITARCAEQARNYGLKIARALNYVGVMAVEFFIVPADGGEQVLVNEIAPRVHNSGHWTLDGCLCSQFEQHIRAIAGWPLAPATRHSDMVMVNLLGEDILNPDFACQTGLVTLYDYGKKDIRPGRKMGHVNCLMPLLANEEQK